MSKRRVPKAKIPRRSAKVLTVAELQETPVVRALDAAMDRALHEKAPNLDRAIAKAALASAFIDYALADGGTLKIGDEVVTVRKVDLMGLLFKAIADLGNDIVKHMPPEHRSRSTSHGKEGP